MSGYSGAAALNAVARLAAPQRTEILECASRLRKGSYLSLGVQVLCASACALFLLVSVEFTIRSGDLMLLVASFVSSVASIVHSVGHVLLARRMYRYATRKLSDPLPVPKNVTDKVTVKASLRTAMLINLVGVITSGLAMQLTLAAIVGKTIDDIASQAAGALYSTGTKWAGASTLHFPVFQAQASHAILVAHLVSLCHVGFQYLALDRGHVRTNKSFVNMV